jgi:hypothetical protein
VPASSPRPPAGGVSRPGSTPPALLRGHGAATARPPVPCSRHGGVHSRVCRRRTRGALRHDAPRDEPRSRRAARPRPIPRAPPDGSRHRSGPGEPARRTVAAFPRHPRPFRAAKGARRCARRAHHAPSAKSDVRCAGPAAATQPGRSLPPCDRRAAKAFRNRRSDVVGAGAAARARARLADRASAGSSPGRRRDWTVLSENDDRRGAAPPRVRRPGTCVVGERRDPRPGTRLIGLAIHAPPG